MKIKLQIACNTKNWTNVIVFTLHPHGLMKKTLFAAHESTRERSLDVVVSFSCPSRTINANVNLVWQWVEPACW
jgi:hypothetical protein